MGWGSNQQNINEEEGTQTHPATSSAVRASRAARSFEALVGVAIPAWLVSLGLEREAERLESLAVAFAAEAEDVFELRKALRAVRELGRADVAHAAVLAGDWLQEAQSRGRAGQGADQVEAWHRSILSALRGLQLLTRGEGAFP